MIVQEKVDNEIQSAEMFRKFCADASCISKADENEVAEWILQTANHHEKRVQGDLAIFLDSDLAVLSLPAARCFIFLHAHFVVEHCKFRIFVCSLRTALCAALWSLSPIENPVIMPSYIQYLSL